MAIISPPRCGLSTTITTTTTYLLLLLLIVIIIICKVPTLRLKTLNKHNITHIICIEMEILSPIKIKVFKNIPENQLSQSPSYRYNWQRLLQLYHLSFKWKMQLRGRRRVSQRSYSYTKIVLVVRSFVQLKNAFKKSQPILVHSATRRLLQLYDLLFNCKMHLRKRRVSQSSYIQLHEGCFSCTIFCATAKMHLRRVSQSSHIQLHEDCSSFAWHQPCDNQRVLLVHHFGGYKK